MVVQANGLSGTGATVNITEVRKGTFKAIQYVSVSTTASSVSNDTEFQFQFKNQVTGWIPAAAVNGSCNRRQQAVQTITSSTIDTTASGGDDTVSPFTTFTLIYDGEQSNAIYANPNFGDCSIAAAAIKSELQNWPEFYLVTVTYQSTGQDEGCVWTITFNSAIGNIPKLQVQAKHLTSTDGPSYSALVADDTISVCKQSSACKTGSVDIIKSELELLSNIGTVTVTADTPSSAGECTWAITFDTNAGTVPQLLVSTDGSTFSSSSTSANDAITACDPSYSLICRNSTSTALGGYFSLEFAGQRTGYLPHDISAYDLKNNLESLSTIGTLDVFRAGPDENGGYTWSVTFLTDFGDLDSFVFDDLALSGTVATAMVTEATKGVFPPFNSLDPVNGLPLGSRTITDLTELGMQVRYLERI